MKQKQRKTVFWIVMTAIFVIIAGLAEWAFWPIWWGVPAFIVLIIICRGIVELLFKFQNWASKPDTVENKTV